MSDEEPAEAKPIRRKSNQISLRELLLWVTMVALGAAYLVTQTRLRTASAELERLRLETGYLAPSSDQQIAAVRAPNDEPLTYQFRIRVPDEGRYRIAYSSVWPEGTSGPDWFAAVGVDAGESIVLIRILKDPRDERWKITSLVRSERGTKRVGTVLPPEHTKVLLKSNDRMSLSVKQKTILAAKSETLRLVDERWIVGEKGLLLYGDRSPEGDQIGVFAELQPDIGPL